MHIGQRRLKMWPYLFSTRTPPVCFCTEAYLLDVVTPEILLHALVPNYWPDQWINFDQNESLFLVLNTVCSSSEEGRVPVIVGGNSIFV